MSSLTTFASWISKYPTWIELKEWLTTSETGVQVVEAQDSPYVILKNSKDKDTDTLVSEAEQLCRSVVWDTRTNTPCSVAPFPARRDDKIPFDRQLYVEDFVEGVMINIFRSKGDKETHVTTRSRLDADGTFYSERSFSELFEEAMDTKRISLSDINKVMGNPNTEGVASVFMSLVLAHPEHRVVRSVEKANFWAIYRGVVYTDGKVEFFTEDIPVAWRPKTYSEAFKASNWQEVKESFEQIKASKAWYWQGLVIHTGAGAQRWRFRNGDHDRVRRELRGKESNPYGRFLRLRVNKRVREYLRVYPEDDESFQEFENDYRKATKTIYAWYCKCHKEHAIAFKALPKSVQPLVFGLHKMYLETLRPERKSLYMADVIEWVTGHLAGEFGIANMIRFSKEESSPYSLAVDVASTGTPTATDAEFDDGAHSPRIRSEDAAEVV
jgi:hypothetical protein